MAVRSIANKISDEYGDRLMEAARAIDSGDVDGGMFLLRRLEADGYLGAPLLLAHCLEAGLPDKIAADPEKALAIYERLASEDDFIGSLSLGRINLEGKLIPQDLEAAYWHYRKVADQGDAVAQFVVGVMHLQGLHVEKDKESALAWFEDAASGGHLYARMNVGLLSIAKGQVFRGLAIIVGTLPRIAYERLVRSESEKLQRI